MEWEQSLQLPFFFVIFLRNRYFLSKGFSEMLYVLVESLLSNKKVTHAFNLLELSLGTRRCTLA